jgi:succinate-semialdehyde dehydrogenase / glutarate-semialdehyde dehydrogenase
VGVEYKVINPATGQVESEFPTATDAEIESAVARVSAAHASWAALPVEDRAAVIHRVADLYDKRVDELAGIITREMGKATAEAVGEVEFSASIYRYYADNAASLLADEPIPADSGNAVIRKAPIGALLGIMPWNYPYYQVARFAGPNLLAGNTVLLKHAPQCPESALVMEQIFREAGVPEDAYVNIFASNEQAAAIIADPRVRGVSVTGSERAGTAVASLAGANLKKVVLELGGSDPYLVLETDDLDRVVKACAAARMENGGQACNAAKRLIVADHLYDEFVDKLTDRMASYYTTGDPTDPSVKFGPMSSEAAVVNLDSQVQDAIAKGATVRTGGARIDGPGAYYPATVLTDVTPEMRAFREELFGPVAVVYKVSTIDEAVELANDTPYGLGASVFHSDTDVALAVANRIDTGMVFINDAEGGGPELPFGGTKRSGVGRELGPYGIDEFLNKKLIHVPTP